MDAVSVTAAGGFRANGVHCGIKAAGVRDLSIVLSDHLCPTAGVFTTSRAPAPPVDLSRARVATGSSRGVIVNSGSANAGTGPAGLADAEAMAAHAAESLGCDPDHLLVCSTVPIGARLAIDRIARATPDLIATAGSTPQHGTDAAEGIMTTDSVTKEAVSRNHGVTVGGMAKGAGMLRPDMATMLAFLTTDAIVDPSVLASCLRDATTSTFNALNVDGCQSTNDSVIVLASGASGVSLGAEELTVMMESVCADLAEQMARDAEGATKVVEILVTGAASTADARTVGLAVADSALVRASFYGADPNWGRVLGAVGAAGVDIDQSEIEITYQDTVVARHGTAVGVDEDLLSAELEGDFTLAIHLGDGSESARVLTTDLTPEYVVFNGERS